MVSMQIAALLTALAGVGETELLDFHAPWCAPCRSMDATVAELKQAGYPVRKINIDHDRSLAARYQVTSIPCFVMVVNGQEVGRITGASRRSELLALFDKARIQPDRAGTEVARAQSPDVPVRTVSLPGDVQRDPFSTAAGSGAAHDRCAVGAAPSGQGPASMQDLVESSVRLTVQDPKGNSFGTGTLIDSRQGEALILTCGHIFRDAGAQGQILVDLFGPQAPQKVPGRLVAFDLKNDIGLVSIRPGVPVHVARVAPKGQPINKGDRVISVGCNNGGPATALESKITGINKFLGPANLQVAGQPVQGRSGGGLFTSEGLVIGVCNAADPADNEGLYAALATIHAQLDQSHLAAVYEQPAPGGASGAPGGMPTMPARMPEPRFASQNTPQPAPGAPFAGAAFAGQLNGAERAALAKAEAAGDNAEVICIVRSLADPQARSQVIKLDRASSAFLKQLAEDREAQESRHLTSLEVRRQQPNVQSPPTDEATGTRTSVGPATRTWR